MPLAVVMRSGCVVVLLGAEVGAEAAPGADHLVGDEDDPELVADLAHALEVALRRGEAAARVLHRLEDHARDRLRALEQDALVDRLGRVLDLGPVAVRVGDVASRREQRLERAPHVRDAGRGERAHGRAVVGELARDDLVAARVAGELVVLAAELERRVDGLRAAGGEEDAVEVAGGELGDARGELDRLRVRVVPVRVEAELLGLVGAGLGDVAAAVADVHAEQGGEPVEVALAVLVVDVAPVAADDDRDLVVARSRPCRVKCIHRWRLASSWRRDWSSAPPVVTAWSSTAAMTLLPSSSTLSTPCADLYKANRSP